jgi:hypothetical protein
LEERIATLEVAPEEAVEAFAGPGAPAACEWRLDGMIEAACDNLAAVLHKADMWAKRCREIYTVHRGDDLVATATYKHTTMEAA